MGLRFRFLVLLLAGCTTASPTDAGAPRDAMSNPDGGADASGLDALSNPDAPIPLDALTADAPMPLDDVSPAVDAPTCELVTAGATSLGLCADRYLACRVAADGSTFCGDTSGSMTERAVCSTADAVGCDRGLQCLRIDATRDLTCRRFCHLADGAADCTGSRTCVAVPDLLGPDDAPVALPAGVGLCD